MPRQPAPPKAGKDELVHLDLQQCPDQRAPHIHGLCHCDPDADVEVAPNLRAHIKQTLAGHWPLTPDQDVAICTACYGAVKRTSTHKAALHYQPLGAKS